MFHNLAEEHLKHHKFTHFWKRLWRPVDNISQSLSPCCSSCATGLLQNKDQNNLAVKGFFPAPSGSGPTKTPLKFQSLQFFLIEFNKNVFWLFFFFPAFFCPSCSSGLITPTSPQHPSPVFLGLRSCFRLPIVNKLVANEGVVKKVFKKCDMPLHTALATSLNIESLKLCYLPSSCYFYL